MVYEVMEAQKTRSDRAKPTCQVKMRVKHDDDGRTRAEIALKGNEKPLNELSESELNELAYRLYEVTGVADNELRTFLLESILRAMPANDGRSEEYLNVALQSLNELRPADLTEALLCSQAIALYAQGMHFMRRAGECQAPIHEQFYLNTSMKLLALHQETLSGLERYRRKGEQRVLVQHINVEGGGRAIVQGAVGGL